MKVVLYTHNLEPITILDLPLWAISKGRQRGVFILPVLDSPMTRCDPTAKPLNHPRIVYIEFTTLIWRNGSVHDILITADEESALLLKASWLPGQQRMVNEYQALEALVVKILGHLN